MADVITSEQVRAARALLRWEQKDLAEASKVSLPTIKRLEGIAGQLKANDLTIDALIRAFEIAGLQFIYPNDGGAGVRWRDNPAKLAPKGTTEKA